MKRMIALVLACLLLLGQSALGEMGASIGTDGRLVVPGREDAGIGGNVQSIVAQTDDRVYYTEGAEAGGAEQANSLWVYANGSAQRVSDLASNAVYAQESGTIYFLLDGGTPQLMALDVATGKVAAVPELDLKDASLNEPEIVLTDGGITVYTKSESGVKTVAATLSLPASPALATAAPVAEAAQGLSRGSKGEDVRSLQARLIELSYPAGTADGVFGYKTYQAVRYFQDALGIDQTGVVTPELKEQIFADGAPEYQQYVALDRGSHGIRVEALQARLRALYYTTDAVDGDYGSRTADAVRLFQKKAGLGQTGAASVETLAALMSKNAPAFSGYVPLAEGDTGSRVKKLQERLYKLGYYAGARDGTYDSRTVKAIKLFQKVIGVKQTGAANVKLQERLFSSKAPKCKEYIELKYGDTGTRVKELQKRLTELGYYDGEIGGHFRSLTRSGVKAFQKAIGVKQTGVATVSLQKKLFADDAPAATPSPAP
jgi:peptidoglycan hydrolase-like protein with peptidoglycan-binding domain